MLDTALLLAVLLGAGAAFWGHTAQSGTAFYAGASLLILALGPLAFAAGRNRWPLFCLRLCTLVTVVIVALLGIDLVWTTALALNRSPPQPPAEPVFTFAAARADPDGFRRWWRESAATLRPSSFITEDPQGLNPFVLAPNSEAKAMGSTVRINSLGFRGPEISRDKGDAFRIIALGESTTFGYTLFAADEPWPSVLERLIREELGCAAPVEVVNGGVPGWTLANQLRRLQADILPLDPDLVISYHGYNGFQYLFNQLPSVLVKNPPGEITRPSRVLAALEGVLSRRRFLARYEAARELASSLPDDRLQASAYAGLYRKLAQRVAISGSPLAIATFNMAVKEDSPEEVIEFYEQAFPDVRARILANRMHTKLVLEVPLGGTVIPVDTREGLDGEYETFYIDAAHLTQAGRDRLAENLLAGLRDLLLRHPRMRCSSSSSWGRANEDPVTARPAPL